MNVKLFMAAFIAACSIMSVVAVAQPRMPTKQETAQLQRLAAQSVLHVETALKKIEQAGPTGNEQQLRTQVVAPATELVKEWRSFQLADSVMMPYMACQEMLSDVQIYGKDALTPPKYHLSMAAAQKLRFIRESLADCRKLRKSVSA